MASITVTPLSDDLNFGARINGVSFESLKDEKVRQQINDTFHDRGMIIFENVEPSGQLHVELSLVFGPLKEHPVPVVPLVGEENDVYPGVIDMRYNPDDAGIVEIQGKRLSGWLPWHFDHCYNNELNRAGVLRALIIPPEGGMTGFSDGIDLYRNIDQDLLARIEGENVLYNLDTSYANLRFALPPTFKEIRPKPGTEAVLKQAATMARAIHPAVWTRTSGEKVLHVSPWMACGLEGREDPEGNALLTAICGEIVAKAKPYFHTWRPGDMVIWDNWRVLHAVSGHNPDDPRRMQRTTIRGDYGLGRFENGGVGGKLLEMEV